MTALLALIAKEYRQTLRDRRMLPLLIVAPVLQLLVLGLAVRLEVEHVPLIAADADGSPASRELIAAIEAGDAFDLVGSAADAAEAVTRLVAGEASVAVVIPRGWAERGQRGRSAAVQVLVDGGDSNRATVASSAVMGLMLARSMAQASERLALLARERGAAVAIPRVRVEPRVLYNPGLDSQVYFVPGVAAILLLVVTTVITAMGLAREKEMGTLEQVLVTPISPAILILGKTLPYVLIGLVDLGLVLGLGSFAFGVPLRGPLVVVFAAGLLYMLSTLGLGLLVSTLAATQQQALMGAIFILLPSVLLSGFTTPVANMPWWLQPFSAFTPVRHFVEILRAVLLKGASFGDLQAQFAALAGIGLAVLALAVVVLRRRLS